MSSDEPLTSTSIFIELQVSTIFTSEPTLQTTNTLASSTSRPTSSITPTTIETASSPSTTSQTRSEQSSMIIQTTLLTEIATSSERRPETTSTTTRPARTTTSSTSINTAPWAAATFSPSARACPEIHVRDICHLENNGELTSFRRTRFTEPKAPTEYSGADAALITAAKARQTFLVRALSGPSRTASTSARRWTDARAHRGALTAMTPIRRAT